MRTAVAIAIAVVALAAGSRDVRAQPTPVDPATLPTSAEAPDVILFTFGPGDRIFERFGHAALCLRYGADDARAVCFNYGVTDFDSGWVLTWNFLRGTQRFWVDPENWETMLRFYEREDRDIWRQDLALTPAQRRAVEAALHRALEPANREYDYDHFFDNCTTRLRDVIDRAVGGKLSAGATGDYPLSFRQLGHRGLVELPALYALADFVAGRTIDATPTVWQAMFYPDVLRHQVAVELGATPTLVNARKGPPFPTEGTTGRLAMFVIGLGCALPIGLARWRRRLERVALGWTTFYLGLWGLVIWSLVAMSSIPALRWNEAVLVLVPLDLALPLFSVASRRRYARIRIAGLLAVSALAAIGVLHQPLFVPISWPLVPLAIIAFW